MKEPINIQIVNKSFSASQLSVNLSVSHSSGRQLISQSVSLSVNLSVSQSGRQLISQSVRRFHLITITTKRKRLEKCFQNCK